MSTDRDRIIEALATVSRDGGAVSGPPRLASAASRLEMGALNRERRAVASQALEYADAVARFVREVLPEGAGTVLVHHDYPSPDDGRAAIEVQRPDGTSVTLAIDAKVWRVG